MDNYYTEKNGSAWLVIESKTKYVMEEFEKASPANDMAGLLNQGYGFDGNTPAFFCQKGKIKYNPPDITFSLEE